MNNVLPELSIIVPFYNEEENIRRHARGHRRRRRAAGHLLRDGPRQRRQPRRHTGHIAIEIARRDPRVRVVKFRRNYGQTPAMAAGIEQARGEVLVTMDGDLQNDPRDIGTVPRTRSTRATTSWSGWRFNRQDKLVSRKIPSRIANWLIGKVTGVPIKDNGCSLKAYPRVADQGDSAVFGDAPLHSGDGLDRRPAHRGDQGAPSRAAVRPVQVRPVARLQGAARPHGHQDGGLVHRRARCCGSACWPCRSCSLALPSHSADSLRGSWARARPLPLPIAGTGLILLMLRLHPGLRRRARRADLQARRRARARILAADRKESGLRRPHLERDGHS